MRPQRINREFTVLIQFRCIWEPLDGKRSHMRTFSSLFGYRKAVSEHPLRMRKPDRYGHAVRAALMPVSAPVHSRRFRYMVGAAGVISRTASTAWSLEQYVAPFSAPIASL